MKNQSELFEAISSFARWHRWERAQERVQALAKIHVIDGVSVMFAGAATDRVQALGAMPGGPSGALQLGSFGQHARSPADAAYAYALSGRLLDYDDVQTASDTTYGLLANPTVPVLAAGLAMAQAKHASGKALLNAYLIGVEVATRLAAGTAPMNLANRIAATTTFGGLGALIAAAQLSGLDKKRTRAALDTWQLLVAMAPLDYDSATNVAYRDAHSVRMAVEAVLMAQNQVGPEPTFRGPLSVVNPETVRFFRRKKNRSYYLQEPGLAIRIYPSSPLTHPAVDATLAIVNVHGIGPADIEHVEVGVTRIMLDRLSTELPRHVSELGHSLPYAIALAVCRGTVELEDFHRFPTNAAIVDMMPRVRIVADPGLDDQGYDRAHTCIRVKLHSGRIIALKIDVAKGSPQKPLSELELSHKFFQCALRSINEHHAEEILNRLWTLDGLDDVALLFDAGHGASETHYSLLHNPERRTAFARSQAHAAGPS